MAEPTLGSHGASTHIHLQPLFPPALPGVGFWALFPHMVPTVGRLLLSGCPRWHGRAPQGTAPQGTARSRRLTEFPPLPPVTVLKHDLGFPPRGDKLVPLQRPQPHPKALAPEERRGSSRQPLSSRTLWDASYRSSPARRPLRNGAHGPSAAAVGTLRWARAAGPPSQLLTAPRRRSSPAPAAGQRWSPAGRRRWGSRCPHGHGRPGSGVREPGGAVGAERGPPLPPRTALCPRPAPSPEGRTGLPPPASDTGLRTSTKESSRKELIKEFQFPSTQPLVLCEHKTKPGHSHC